MHSSLRLWKSTAISILFEFESLSSDGNRKKFPFIKSFDVFYLYMYLFSFNNFHSPNSSTSHFRYNNFYQYDPGVKKVISLMVFTKYSHFSKNITQINCEAIGKESVSEVLLKNEDQRQGILR